MHPEPICMAFLLETLTEGSVVATSKGAGQGAGEVRVVRPSGAGVGRGTKKSGGHCIIRIESSTQANRRQPLLLLCGPCGLPTVGVATAWDKSLLSWTQAPRAGIPTVRASEPAPPPAESFRSSKCCLRPPGKGVP